MGAITHSRKLVRVNAYQPCRLYMEWTSGRRARFDPTDVMSTLDTENQRLNSYTHTLTAEARFKDSIVLEPGIE